MRRYTNTFSIGERVIAPDRPTFFIADIAANHDGELERAKHLILLAAAAGADAVKFQHFTAKTLVSDVGFRELGSQIAHQAAWKEPVFKVYERYSLDRRWDASLMATARDAGVYWMTTPYDTDAADALADAVPAFKIGSGDITWLDGIEHVARKGKPILIATGASTMDDVEAAVEVALSHNSQVCIMQCNTNYTAQRENFRHVNLSVLQTYAARWPGMILGLSDHTPGHATVLGAVALGARIIEKHFTDDNSRPGPDHLFSMTPASWSEMVERTRDLEFALGDGVKRVEANESESAIVQRRCLRLRRDMPAGAELTAADLESLRPAPLGTLSPAHLQRVLGSRLVHALPSGSALHATDIMPRIFA